jgi:hypothetical protein
MFRLLLILSLLVFFAAPVTADQLDDGKAAYVRGDYQTALQLWQPLADQGNADAQEKVGIMFLSGHGVIKDQVIAVKWLRKAAENGNRKAQRELASAYRLGIGVPKDRIEAKKWFLLADKNKLTPLAKAKSKICKYFENEKPGIYRELLDQVEVSQEAVKGAQLTKLELPIENTKNQFEVYSIDSCSHYFCGSYIVYFPKESSQKESFVNCLKNLNCPIKETASHLTSPDFLVDNIPAIWSEAKVVSGVDGGRSGPRYTYSYPVLYRGKYYIYLLDSAPNQSDGPTVLALEPQKNPQVLCAYKEPAENQVP